MLKFRKLHQQFIGNNNISWCKSKTFHGEINLAGWVTFQIFPLFWNSPFLRGHVTLIPKSRAGSTCLLPFSSVKRFVMNFCSKIYRNVSFFRRNLENNVIYYLFKGQMVGYPKGIKVKMDVKGLSLTKVRSSTELFEDGKAG